MAAKRGRVPAILEAAQTVPLLVFVPLGNIGAFQRHVRQPPLLQDQYAGATAEPEHNVPRHERVPLQLELAGHFGRKAVDTPRLPPPLAMLPDRGEDRRRHPQVRLGRTNDLSNHEPPALAAVVDQAQPSLGGRWALGIGR